MLKSKALAIDIAPKYGFYNVATEVVWPIVESRDESTGIPPNFDISNYSLESVEFQTNGGNLSSVECQLKVRPDLGARYAKFYPSPLTIPVNPKLLELKFLSWVNEDMSHENDLYKKNDFTIKWKSLKMTMQTAEAEKNKELVSLSYTYKKPKAGQVVEMNSPAEMGRAVNE